MATETKTGGRAATAGVIGGGTAIAVGRPLTATPDGFEWTPLSEVARLETGHTPSRRHSEYWGGDIGWIGIKDATANHGRTIFSTNQTVTEAGIANSSARILPTGTVCLSRTASVGYVVVMGTPMSTSQDFVNWVCGPELDNRYLKYVLQLERDTLLRFASGTTHQTIYFPEAKAFHALLPQIDAQRAIADVLGALDDKVESNRRLVTDVLNLCGPLLARADQHPVRVGDVATLDKGVSYKGSGLADGPSDGLPMVNLANFSTQGWLKVSGLKHYSGEFKSRHVARPGDLLVANTDLTQQRTILGRPALVPPGSEMLFTHHVYAVRFTSRSELCLPLWAALQTSGFRERAEGFATGTTVAGMPKETLLDFRFNVCHDSAIADAAALVDRAWSAERESAALVDLRDTLLPELLSGRIRVRVAEELVEAAT